MHTTYVLPFAVTYPGAGVLSSSRPVELRVRLGAGDGAAARQVVEVFTRLAATGALVGRDLDPASSGLVPAPPEQGAGQLRFPLLDCRVDDCALVVLAHLFLARSPELALRALEVATPGREPDQVLRFSRTGLATYPGVAQPLPFPLTDEDPEGGGYTFTAELLEPLRDRCRDALDAALTAWVEAVRAGAYALAPIPPRECYAEPLDAGVTSFGRTVEWAVEKVRADPACIGGLVNLFAAFHGRCQPLAGLLIS
jgi:hypothetical protein